ncbi:gamma carbonic anhydrase family protein [Pararhodonellum marinum]|uniref:gamma carbonic anhydrase family protein n=1 Tax=Pararhodonellum marinum TaxID=2755358 RepID=UPI0018908DAC|nr:gamma carbonic anhydrase family protein [Pararhodonellum marinum]
MPTIITLHGKTPQMGKDAWIAENATLVGDVVMGEACTVWFNAVVRGDVHEIRIGDQTNIQDGAVIHCTYQKFGTYIGSRVSIAHNAIVHGCTIHDDVLIGMGAIVMDGAVVHSGAVIAAGAVVLSGTVVEANSIYAGMPARKVKTTGPEMLETIQRTARNYPMYAKWFEEESNISSKKQ